MTEWSDLFGFNGFFSDDLKDADPDIYKALDGELERQQDGIELIASENIVSRAVMQTMGSVFTNKYAEGYPGRRYYGGCEVVDVAEDLAIERAKKIFNAGFANVQPHSGAQANQGVFFALLQPGDTFLGLNLACGGHLTHGAAPNQSGKWFKAVQYDVRKEDARIDFEQVEKLAQEHKPKLIIAGGSAYPRVLDFKRFREVADSVGAYLMVDMAHFAGLVAGGQHPNPVDFCRCRDHDHPQNPARPAWRHDPDQRRSDREEDQLLDLPGSPGRSADACHRVQGCCLW